MSVIAMTTGRTLVAGARICWWQYGEGKRTRLLLHGGGGHSGWWNALLPMMQGRVVTMDLSGHGDSDHRPAYTYRQWADEVAAVIEAAGGDPVDLVCHSMSGRIGVLATVLHPVLVRELILVDSVVPTHDGEPRPDSKPTKVHRTREDAVARFRLLPLGGLQPPAPTLRRLAEGSLREVPGGWTWKFDPPVFEAFGAAEVNSSIPLISRPVSIVHAAESPVTDHALFDLFRAQCGTEVRRYDVLPGTDHHLMVDRPEVLARWLGAEEPAVQG